MHGPGKILQDLTEDDQVRLKAVLEQCPEPRSAADHVRAFGEMLIKLRGQEPPPGSPRSAPRAWRACLA